jgi:hypothetical protein
MANPYKKNTNGVSTKIRRGNASRRQVNSFVCCAEEKKTGNKGNWSNSPFFLG